MQMGERFSQIVASIFIVMLYSLSMPFLYLAAALIFFSMYWVDKYLFLRYWKTPPKFSTELARRVYYILEWSIILHLLFGLYMISNPRIFSFNSNVLETEYHWAFPMSALIGRWSAAWFGTTEGRFKQVHVIVYMVGICIFLILFIIERLTGLISKLVDFIIHRFTNKVLHVL
jgi:hypothetical protein